MSSSPSSSSSGKASISSLRNGPIDPITRTALRYTISPREYELLHQYFISRAPVQVQKRTLHPTRYQKITGAGSENGNGDSNVAAIRAALRMFAVIYVGLKGWEIVMGKLAARRGGPQAKQQVKTVRLGNVRVALSFSGVWLFHRLLHRFFRLLRVALLEDDAQPFRLRNPKVAQALTSHYTPAIGAAMSGFFLGVSPADQMRITIAIYVFTRTLEFTYNALEESGALWKSKEKGGEGRPWWFGSWMLMPLTCGQLLHAFVFDRDCFPEDFGKFILKRSPEYIQLRPEDYQSNKPWPGTFDIVDALAELSRLRWPPFISPIIFPSAQQPLPISLAKISQITSPAHPAIKHTSCALLHPHDPSCGRTYMKYWARAFPNIARFFTLVYGGFALLAYKSLLKDPMPFINRLSARILRMSIFVTGAIGTSWGSICLFNNTVPRTFLPTQRWFLGGFLGGMWAYVARRRERDNFVYSARLSIDSLYKVGKKRGWWRGIRNGDVLLFVTSIALLGCVYEARPDAVKGGFIRKAISASRGEGWVDCVAPTKEAEEKKVKEEAEEQTLGEVVKEEDKEE